MARTSLHAVPSPALLTDAARYASWEIQTLARRVRREAATASSDGDADGDADIAIASYSRRIEALGVALMYFLQGDGDALKRVGAVEDEADFATAARQAG